MKKILFSLTVLLMYASVSAQIVNKPDANFKAQLLQADSTNQIAKDLNGVYFKIDANNDSQIQVSEAIQVSYLDVRHNFSNSNNPFVTSLVGILSFVNLHSLNCANNQLTSLNLSGLTNLKDLDCLSNSLTSMNLSGLTNLQSLNCGGAGNQFGTLDLSALLNLTTVSCPGNGLSSLNVSGLTNLQTLDCSFNNFTSLDLSTLTNLQTLYCPYTGLLTSLDLNKLIKLQSLDCSNDSALTTLYMRNGVVEGTLNLANCPLFYVCADPAQITAVKSLVPANCIVDDICSPPQISEIVVIPDADFLARLLEADSSNQIAKNLSGYFFKVDANNDSKIQVSEALQVSYLDVSTLVTSTPHYIQSMEGILNFSNLEYLNTVGTGSKIPSLDLHGLSKMKTLLTFASDLNLAGLTNLENLSLVHGNFTTLDVSVFPKLKTLTLDANALVTLDVSGLVNLEELQCSTQNNLTQLKFSGNISLKTLNVIYNPALTSLDVTNLPNLTALICYGSAFTTLNLNSLTKLENLNCNSSKLTSLYINNGANESSLDLSNNPDLSYVCADSAQIANIKTLVPTNCVVDDICSPPQPSPDIVVIPDANFKAKLLSADSNNKIAEDLNGNSFKIDANNDGEIQVSEAAQVSDLDVNTSNISSLEGILSFTNLSVLVCNMNKLTALNITPLTKLQFLRCSDNQLTTLDLTGLTNLVELHCSTNAFTTLNINGLPNLQILHCEVNNLTTLDATALSNLKELQCSHNQLTSLFIKNGSSEILDISNNPNLQFICADDFQLLSVQNEIAADGYSNCTLSTYCSFTPGGQFYTVQGNNRIDLTGNGCDATDMAISNPKFTITNGSSTETAIANATGLYNFPVGQGTHTITPVLENPSYFNVSPTSVTVTFPTQMSPLTQDFCYAKNGIHADLEVFIVPVFPAVPGLDATFRIIYKNKGNQTLSGNVNFVFDDSVLDFVSSSPTVSNQTLNNLSWNFTDLLPFETKVIIFALNVNSPTETPAVKGGDILNYNAAISSSITDETPNDNSFALVQTVLSSYDPNDKICLEGNTIEPSRIGDYLHYMIRFKNTGTYPAKSIVVTDMIDTAKFDVGSLIPMSGSHAFVTRITDANKVEFIFENINLPFDDSNNDGYVAFKIKTLPTLVLGNTLSNTANIYFDYNKPIDTNTATTTITALAKQDFTFSNYFSLYPNPVKDVLNISKSESIELSSISIYNVLGQLIMIIPNAQNISRVDVSHLDTGIYFIKINSDKGISNARFIKK